MAFSKFQGKSSYMFTLFIFRDSQQLYQAWHSWTMISPGSVFWAGLSAQGSRFSEGREQHITTLHRSLWSLSASAYLRGSWHWATALLSSSSHCSSKNLLLLPHRWAGVKQWQNQALNTTCCPGTSPKMNKQSLEGTREDATLRIPTLHWISRVLCEQKCHIWDYHTPVCSPTLSSKFLGIMCQGL